MRKAFHYALAFFCLSFAFIGCSDNEDPKHATDLTPDENKAVLEEIGLKLTGKIDADAHKDLVNVVDEFAKAFEYFDEDDYVEIEPEEMIKNVRSICTRSNLGLMADYADVDNDIYSLVDNYGIYTFDSSQKEWTEKESNDKLEFIFPVDGKNATITIIGTGEETVFEESGETISAPRNAELVIKWDSNELCKLNASQNLNSSSYDGSAVATLVASGYTYEFSAMKSDSKSVTGKFTFKKGSETLISSDAQLAGTGITTGDTDPTLKGASGKIYVMDDANFSISCSDIDAMEKEMDKLEDDASWSYGDPNYYWGQEWKEKEAGIWNKYMKVEMRYEGSDKVIATIISEEYEEEAWGTGNDKFVDWDTRPVLVFEVDGSKHDMDSYFNDIDFKDLIDSFNKLEKAFEELVD